jgi:hypothetical protein
MEAIVAAAVALLFFAFAGYAASVGVDAIRTRTYLPRLGLELSGGAAVAAGWATLVFACAFFAAGALVTFVASRA